MTPEHWSEVEEVYQSAMDQEPAARSAYLDQACEGNPQLRRDVDSLLVLNDSPLLVDQPAWQVAPELLDDVDLPPGAELGPYRIEALLGAGGMGRVYRARDPRLGRSVALKIPTVEFNERFEREARTVAALNHPNICTLHDVGPNYLVLELVEGPTLADRLKEGPIPAEEAFGIAGYIAAALEAAHEQGIVHRDLKPGNIKIKPDGTVKVLDFGLAKLIEPAGSERDPKHSPTLTFEQATRNGMILGTAAYMSPEQVRGKRVDKRADIWSFGVVLYEMLTGKPLFQRETVSDTLAAVITEEADLDRVPPKVRNLLRRCLAKDSKRRLRDIGDAMELLDDLPATVLRPAHGTRWIWPGIAVLSLIALVALSLIHFREKPAPPGELMRFQVPLPEGATISSRSTFAVSPDGRRLAFFAAGSDNVTRLWLRSLDSLEAKPLPGSETTATSPPFWSPDGRYIALEAGGKLRKIEIATGAIQTLCDVPKAVAGGSWNRNGVIIFGTEAVPSALMGVSAGGGVPYPITIPHGPGTRHRHPIFLPDGRHFLYLRTGRGEGIYIGSLDARPEEQDSRSLLGNSSSAVYVASPKSETGQLLFVREDTLLAQPFDPRRLELTGEAVPIAEQVNFSGTTGWGPFSAAANGLLVYRGSGQSRQFAWWDRQRNALDVIREFDSGEYISLSPDSTHAAVTRGKLGRQTNIWLLDLLGGGNAQITFGSGGHVTPIWSPDGAWIAFSKPPNQLYQKAASGVGDEELLVKENDTNYLRPTDWSRDGRYLLYTNVDPKTRADIWALSNLRGDPSSRKSIPVLKTANVEHFAVLSPDARWMAYLGEDESGREEVYVTSFDVPSGGTSGAGGHWRISQDGAVLVRWRRDGKELFYRRPDGDLIAVEVSTQPVFRQGTHRTLFRTASNAWDVASDGSRFLFSTPPPNEKYAPFTAVMNYTAALKR